METLATKISDNINSIIMDEHINKLSYTKALRYIEDKINEFTNKKSYDKINKSKYVDTIKQLRQKRKEINTNISKLEKQDYKIENLFNEKLKQELKNMKKELKQKNNKTKEDVKVLKTKIKEHPISIKRRLDFEKRRIKEEYRKKLAEKIRITKERLTRKQNKRYDKQQRKINYEIKQAPYKKQDVLYWQFILPQDEEKHDEMINDKIIEVRNKYPIITYGEKIKLEKRVNDISSMFFNDIKSITDINKHLESIYDAQNYAFKINVSYGYVFEEALNMEDYVYWLSLIHI